MTFRPKPRSIASIHAEWLSLLDTSGPFLSVEVLTSTDGFRQGLPQSSDSPAQRRDLANYFEQWLSSTSHRRPDPAIERAWFRVVIEDVLEWGTLALDGQAIPPGFTFTDPDSHETTGPDVVFRDADGKVRLLVQRYPATQSLSEPVPGSRWLSSPATRMVALLQQSGVRLGLVTNGAQWMLVNAAPGEQPGFASWFANLWFEEPSTLDAFRALLGVERFVGVPDDQSLETMLDRSAEELAGVTTTLGYQVRQAIELLVEGIDREDADRHGALLAGVADEEVYEAAISVMMRLVFLLFAEDQQPPLIGGNDLTYEQYYAVSNLIQSLEAVEEEVLEQRRDAWPRLLATFRLVHAGSDHDQMRQPAYGGSLFDPDRFPFLEGREPRTHWSETAARPLPITNRTVLHMLEAIQYLKLGKGQERQRLSFRALDVEQIGHVYEQLLEHTARRASGPVLGLVGATKKGVRDEPEVELADLEAWRAQGESILLKQLKDQTGRTETALKKLLATDPDLLTLPALRLACGSDDAVLQRVLPFAGLIRENRAGRPAVIQPNRLYVTAGNDRSTTGAHYTPRSLTEPIVQYTLEPLVYDGPAEGKPREEWKLLPSKALLSLNICDPAMGSGAFLVQACRYLAERLVESWDQVAREFEASVAHGSEPLRIVPDGSLSRGNPTDELLPTDQAERLAIARRLVADHCLYGVDVNPLAVDMAKLSLWLVTLQANRPFTFLDHRLRSGDSLLGMAHLDQLRAWNLAPDPDFRAYTQTSWFTQQVKNAIERGIEFHRRIEATPVTGVRDIARQADLHRQAEQVMGVIGLGADLLVGSVLVDDKKRRDPVRKTLQMRYSLQMEALQGIDQLTSDNQKSVFAGLQELRDEANDLLGGKRPFHWPLEFPEIFVDSSTHECPGGFSAIVGNPPYLGGSKISGRFGDQYRDYLPQYIADRSSGGHADLAAYFLLRAAHLVQPSAAIGLLLTNSISQGDTREIGLDTLTAMNYCIFRAIRSKQWPGSANLDVSTIWAFRGKWSGEVILDDVPANSITSYLEPLGQVSGAPYCLSFNENLSFNGMKIYGQGFLLSTEEAMTLLSLDKRNREIIFPYMSGDDLNSEPDQAPSRWVINFHDWPLERAMSYPAAFQIVETRVKPDRLTKSDEVASAPWWQFWRRRPDLLRALEGKSTAHVSTVHTKHITLSPAPSNYVFSHALTVLSIDNQQLSALLSSLHASWALAQGSTIGRMPRYTPSDCVETFPFFRNPMDATYAVALLEARNRFMQSNSIGLTECLNQLHDPDLHQVEIKELRDLQENLDNAVLNAYGWNDLDLDHSFHATAQGVRFTISEAARREVLDRLLELNHQRYAEEVAQGLHEKGTKSKAKRQSAAQQTLL